MVAKEQNKTIQSDFKGTFFPSKAKRIFIISLSFFSKDNQPNRVQKLDHVKNDFFQVSIFLEYFSKSLRFG